MADDQNILDSDYTVEALIGQARSIARDVSEVSPAGAIGSLATAVLVLAAALEKTLESLD